MKKRKNESTKQVLSRVEIEKVWRKRNALSFSFLLCHNGLDRICPFGLVAWCGGALCQPNFLLWIFHVKRGKE